MKILLPVDGSELSLEAARFAIRMLLAGLRGEVVLANVQEPASLYELLVAHDPEVINRVAEEAGCAPSLIIHYFQTIDGLMIALYRRSAERELKRLSKLVKQDRPLGEFWNPDIDVALATEFQAMAVHNEVLKDELARNAQAKRALLEKVVNAALHRAKIDTGRFPPSGVAFLFSVYRLQNHTRPIVL